MENVRIASTQRIPTTNRIDSAVTHFHRVHAPLQCCSHRLHGRPHKVILRPHLRVIPPVSTPPLSGLFPSRPRSVPLHRLPSLRPLSVTPITSRHAVCHNIVTPPRRPVLYLPSFSPFLPPSPLPSFSLTSLPLYSVTPLSHSVLNPVTRDQ